MATRSLSVTTTITAGDVRQVMAHTSEEITTICKAAARVARDFDADSALVDCSLLALNDVIVAIRLQFYFADELVREYAYVISGGPLEPIGPPPNQPPLGQIPEGARVRLVATPNPELSAEARDGCFRRLGWIDSTPLRYPEDAHYQTYGTFVSGGYGVERQLLINPKFDQPVTVVPSGDMRKGG